MEHLEVDSVLPADPEAPSRAARAYVQAITNRRPLPQNGPGSNSLNAVAGSAAGQPLWAVGFGTSSGTPQVTTLVETTTG
jgi:hypothetical protein